MKNHIIKTTRLIIRPLEASDYAAWEKLQVSLNKQRTKKAPLKAYYYPHPKKMWVFYL